MFNQNPQAKLTQQVQSNTGSVNSSSSGPAPIGPPSKAPQGSPIAAPKVDAGVGDKKGFKAWLQSKIEPTPSIERKQAPQTGGDPGRQQPKSGGQPSVPPAQIAPAPNKQAKLPSTGRIPKPQVPKFRR